MVAVRFLTTHAEAARLHPWQVETLMDRLRHGSSKSRGTLAADVLWAYSWTFAKPMTLESRLATATVRLHANSGHWSGHDDVEGPVPAVVKAAIEKEWHAEQARRNPPILPTIKEWRKLHPLERATLAGRQSTTGGR